MTADEQPRLVPNPLYCETCKGRGYVVLDAEWESYAVQCPDCTDNAKGTSPSLLAAGGGLSP